MFKVIGIMISGIAAGFLCRKRKIGWIQKLIVVLIWVLLFLLGIEVGSNKTVIENLHTLGLQALIISVAGVLGSSILAWLLWFLINRKRKEGKK